MYMRPRKSAFVYISLLYLRSDGGLLQCGASLPSLLFTRGVALYSECPHSSHSRLWKFSYTAVKCPFQPPLQRPFSQSPCISSNGRPPIQHRKFSSLSFSWQLRFSVWLGLVGRNATLFLQCFICQMLFCKNKNHAHRNSIGTWGYCWRQKTKNHCCMYMS